MKSLKNLFEKLQIRQIIAVFLAGVLLIFTTACSGGNPKNPTIKGANTQGSIESKSVASIDKYVGNYNEQKALGKDAVNSAEKMRKNASKETQKGFENIQKNVSDAAKELTKNVQRGTEKTGKNIQQMADDTGKAISRTMNNSDLN